MSTRLKISNLVIEKLKKQKELSTGQLFGIRDENSVCVLGISLTVENNETEKKEASDDSDGQYDLIPNLPADINLCGAFEVKEGSMNNVDDNEVLDRVRGVPVIINVNPNSKGVIAYFYEDGSLNKVEFTVVNENDISKLFLHLRLTATIPLSCDFQSESVQEAISFIEQKIISGNAAFQFEDSNIYLLGNTSDDISGISPDSIVDELFSLLNESIENKNESNISVCNVNMFLKGSNNEMSPQLAPVIRYVKKIFKNVKIQLSLDSLVMASRNLNVLQLYPLLVESVCRNLILNERSLLEQLESKDIWDVSLPQTYHFLPQSCGHFFSVVYPSKQTEEQLTKSRQTFHLLLSLPTDRPLLRKGNAYDFSNGVAKTDSNLLLNPHEGLGKSGIADGEPTFVQGQYAYHHYMQDNFDDSGWGCAYRSLQTVFSWFRLQGYTNMPIPTHKDIQQCLVNIGDKPGSFVGSKQWIGSTEVSFVLDTMLGVTCRIVNVSSGDEMSMQGGELSYHFKTQGTPVMIGGGVLAHTIIGVDYNRKTGDIKFLILDPHYTGGEDLNVIRNKGWCGWKGVDFWKKGSFYNMCLPLRPKCV